MAGVFSREVWFLIAVAICSIPALAGWMLTRKRWSSGRYMLALVAGCTIIATVPGLIMTSTTNDGVTWALMVGGPASWVLSFVIGLVALAYLDAQNAPR